MAKRIPIDAKISAYNDAIDFLNAQESESDTEDDVRARKWLAAKLDKEADRLAKRDVSSDIGNLEAPAQMNNGATRKVDGGTIHG